MSDLEDFYFGHRLITRADVDRATEETHWRLLHGDTDPVVDAYMPTCCLCGDSHYGGCG